MAFSKKPDHSIRISSMEILNFSTELSTLASVTVNLDERLQKTGELLGI